MKKHFDEQLNIYTEKKKEEDKEKKDREEAKKKRDAEKAKAAQPQPQPQPQASKGAKIEEITEEEAKKIMEKKNEKDEKEENKKEESKDENKDEKKDDDDKEPPPLGNGGKTDKYVWTQTLNEVVINIPVPADTRSKMVQISFGQKKIKIGIKGQPPIIDGEFPERIKVF